MFIYALGRADGELCFIAGTLFLYRSEYVVLFAALDDDEFAVFDELAVSSALCLVGSAVTICRNILHTRNVLNSLDSTETAPRECSFVGIYRSAWNIQCRISNIYVIKITSAFGTSSA